VRTDVSDLRDERALPWRREAGEFEAGLVAWARALRGDGTVVTDLRTPDSGMANDTVMFRLDGEPLVARLAPAPDSPYPTFPTYDLAFQQRVIDLVRARTTVPVPEIVHLEESTGWLGVPFLVTRAIEGVVASDNPPYLLDPNGWVLRGTPEDRTRMETATIDVLVRLHAIPDESEATAFLHPDVGGDTALARQLAYQRTYYDWARDGHTVPILERAFDLLAKTLPANERDVLNWGDSRPGNIIYRDFQPVAVLDWEMATVGPPEVDVAWCTFFQKFWASMGEPFGIDVPAMFDTTATAAIYARLGGAELDDLAWYEALAGLRFGIILARMSLRSVAHGMQEIPADADDLIMFAPLLDRILGDL
jgi:aminoglycoside phosphotransferase (APT) family kinase protein